MIYILLLLSQSNSKHTGPMRVFTLIVSLRIARTDILIKFIYTVIFATHPHHRIIKTNPGAPEDNFYNPPAVQFPFLK